MTEDSKSPGADAAASASAEAPKPVYTQPDQVILPGYKNYVLFPKKDWRSWTDDRGNKIDAPPYKGRTSSGGKTVAPLVGSDGQPIRLGTFQIIRDVRNHFTVIDWSRPLVEPVVTPDDDHGDDGAGAERESSGTAPIMGKQVYRTNQGLERAKSAMAAIFLYEKDRAAGLLPDPAPCFDLKNQRIQIGRHSMCQFARGKAKGRYAIVDEGVALGHERRVVLLKETRFKDAVGAFVKIARKRGEGAPKKKRYVGAPIAFNAPTGGSGGGGGFSSFAEREYPEPGSLSWQTSVACFAQTGRWCRSAEFQAGRPEALEAEALEARAAWLAEDAKRAEEKSAPEVLEQMQKLPVKDQSILNQLIEEFDAVVISLEWPLSKQGVE